MSNKPSFSAESFLAESNVEVSTRPMRTDIVLSAMNGGKLLKVLQLHKAWQKMGVKLGGEQWHLFYTGKGLNLDHRNENENALAREVGTTAHLQMVRYQITPILEAWVKARQKEFTKRVETMFGVGEEKRALWLTERLRYELHLLNRFQAWFVAPESLPRLKDGQEISAEARRIARWLMRDTFSRHNKPNLSRINMVLDTRVAKLSTAIDPVAYWDEKAERKAQLKAEAEERKRARNEAKALGLPPPETKKQKKDREKAEKEAQIAAGVIEKKKNSKKNRAKGGEAARKKPPVITPPREGRESVTIFPLWVRLSTLTLDECINLPLQVNDHYLDRKGDLAGTIQINKRDGKLYFGLVSDMTSNFAGSRKAYSPKCEEVVLDWGIRTLFSTDSGDLLGRGFIDHLKYLDSLITSLASYRQEHGLRVRSAKYDDYVERMRGYVRSEVGRVLNRLVEIHRPGRIVVESLDFRHPELSRRMNRLLSISGRAIVEKKLSVLSERYGIEVVRVPAAYSSQECSSCGYVDAKNRKGEVFECRWCAMKMHADVNAPRALKARRTRTFLVAPGEGEWARGTSRKSILYTLVHEFQMRSGVERSKQGRRGTSCNPRMSNPYFREWKRGESSSVILNGIGVHRDSSGESCASKQ